MSGMRNASGACRLRCPDWTSPRPRRSRPQAPMRITRCARSRVAAMRRALGSSVCATQAQRFLGAAAELLVAPHQALHAQRVVDLHVPDLVEQRRDLGPWTFLQQQVVALGDDELRLRQHGNGAGDRLLDFAPELGRVDDLVRALLAHPPQQRHVAGAVEGVGRALALGPAQALQLHLREMEAVHRHHLRASRKGLLERACAASTCPTRAPRPGRAACAGHRPAATRDGPGRAPVHGYRPRSCRAIRMRSQATAKVAVRSVIRCLSAVSQMCLSAFDHDACPAAG